MQRRPAAWPWIAVFGAVPVLSAALLTGRWHPDEVYQYLEPAWFRVHEYGIRAWEWRVGLRNWAVPILLSWCVRLSAALGITDPRADRLVVGLPLLVLHVVAIAAVFRYVERRVGPDRRWTRLGFVLVAGFGPVLLFAGRTMGESISTDLLLVAVERLDAGGRPARDGLAAGLALGLAVVARYGSAVPVAAALAWLAVRRQWRVLAWTGVAGLVVAAGLGALDQATWGAPFHSLRAYVDFNVVSGRAAAEFGASPWSYYVPLLALWSAPWSWPGLVVAVAAERRVPLPACMAVAYLAALSATPHKEERFLYPALVLLAMSAASGVVLLVRRLPAAGWRRTAAAAAVLSGLVCLGFAPDMAIDEFHAQIRATRDPAATGLLVVGDGIWGCGGSFYVGRQIPLYSASLPADVAAVLRGDHRINRAIVRRGMHTDALRAAGFARAARIGRWRIFVRRDGAGGVAGSRRPRRVSGRAV